MSLSIPDGRQTFNVYGEKMTPGISVSNSEVGLASLSIAAFMLRLVCTNGMISKTEVSASYRHVSAKILCRTSGSFEQRFSGIGTTEGADKIIFGEQSHQSGEHHKQFQ